MMDTVHMKENLVCCHFDSFSLVFFLFFCFTEVRNYFFKDTMIIIVQSYCFCHMELRMLPQRCFHCFYYYRPMPTRGQEGQAEQVPGKI